MPVIVIVGAGPSLDLSYGLAVTSGCLLPRCLLDSV